MKTGKKNNQKMNNTLTQAIKFNWMARLKSNQLKKKKKTQRNCRLIPTQLIHNKSKLQKQLNIEVSADGVQRVNDLIDTIDKDNSTKQEGREKESMHLNLI